MKSFLLNEGEFGGSVSCCDWAERPRLTTRSRRHPHDLSAWLMTSRLAHQTAFRRPTRSGSSQACLVMLVAPPQSIESFYLGAVQVPKGKRWKWLIRRGVATILSWETPTALKNLAHRSSDSGRESSFCS